MEHDPVATAAAVEAFAAPYREASGYDGPITWFAFGDSEEMADSLGALVVTGPKRATAGWLEEDDEDEDLAVGDHAAVLDGRGLPLCVMRTDELRIGPLDSVDPAFAWDEGEGVRTRDDWFEGHERYFRRRAQATGLPFDAATSLIRFERFTVVVPEGSDEDWLVEDGDIRVRPLLPNERPWVRALLGPRTDDAETLAASGGYAADACPALVARVGLQSAGLLVFVPYLDRVDTVTTVLLEDKRADRRAEVGAALAAALDVLVERNDWR